MAVAQELPPEASGPLLERAFAAFTDRLTTSAIVGGIVLTVAAALAGFMLRKVRVEQLADAQH